MNDTKVRSRFIADAKKFVARAELLAADLDPAVMDAVDEASQMSLPAAEAKALYVRVLDVLEHAKEVGLTDSPDTDAVCDAIREATRKASPDVDVEPRQKKVVLEKRNGLSPRPVVPTPTFMGKPVELQEGYVDVLQLPLWIENDRVKLSVQEFGQKNGREPTWNELLKIMVGDVAQLGDREDPFKVKKLAESIRRRGVERPPIITTSGEPKDGNRRIAACKYILDHPEKFKDPAERERAQWIRVWQAPENTTEDQFEEMVVALNFEDDEKEDWAEYIKARRVRDLYDSKYSAEKRMTPTRDKAIKQEVAEHFSIKVQRVTRYLKMVQWANDFEAYHSEERDRDSNETRFRANDIFQYFYELDAGRGGESLTDQISKGDDELRTIVYDLMWDVLDSGALLRGLHKVVAEDSGIDALREAHSMIAADPKECSTRSGPP